MESALRMQNIVSKENFEECVDVYFASKGYSLKLSSDKNYEAATQEGLRAVELRHELLEFAQKNKLNAQKLECEDTEEFFKALGTGLKNIAENHYKNKEYNKALEPAKLSVCFHPKDVFTNFTLAKILQALGLLKEAAPFYERVCEYDKNYHEGRRILGDIYFSKDIVNYDKALYYYNEFKKHSELSKGVKTNISIIYTSLGRQEEADKLTEEALLEYPDDESLITVHLLNYVKMYGKTQEDIKKETEKLIENYIKAKGIRKNAYDFRNRLKDKNKKIRLGYLSTDFGHHIVSKFMMPVIKNHNQDKFEIFLYASIKKDDSKSKQYKKIVGEDHFINCHKMSNEEIAEHIYKDKIDILVDLNMYTGNSRIYSIISKPAPIQAVYLGFPNTSGIDTIDYILTSKDTIKPGEEHLYTEKPAYIEAGYEVCDIDNKATLPEIAPLPYSKNKYITFGVFNATSKVNAYMIGVWARILKVVKNSKILFQYISAYTPENQKRIIGLFKEHGIPENRVLFEDKDSKSHYNKLQLADIALDPHPYSGTGTTIDQVLMGLPIICLKGFHSTSRPTARILKALGYGELIAKDEDEYVELAKNLATSPKLINTYRNTMREQLFNSPLVEFEKFTRSLEETYKKMWKDYCNS